MTTTSQTIQTAIDNASTHERLGRHEHPQHPGSNDWTITLWTIDGVRVAETNGDPVWEEADPAAFAELLEEYGVVCSDEPVVPRAWFAPGSLGDAQHAVACWAVLDPEDATTVEDYRPR